MNGLLDVEFHASLVGNEELLGRVVAYNAEQNEILSGTFDFSTYLLHQVYRRMNTLFSQGREYRVKGVSHYSVIMNCPPLLALPSGTWR